MATFELIRLGEIKFEMDGDWYVLNTYWARGQYVLEGISLSTGMKEHEVHVSLESLVESIANYQVNVGINLMTKLI